MLIRSQDKESIINLDNVLSIDIMGFRKSDDGFFQNYENADIWKVTCTATEMLYIGEYSTKEKAIKVLDRICENYQKLDYVKCGINFVGECSVFQMPQEREVL